VALAFSASSGGDGPKNYYSAGFLCLDYTFCPHGSALLSDRSRREAVRYRIQQFLSYVVFVLALLALLGKVAMRVGAQAQNRLFLRTSWYIRLSTWLWQV